MRKYSYDRSFISKKSNDKKLEVDLLINEEITKDNFFRNAFTNITSSISGLICYILIETINLTFMGKKSNKSQLLLDSVGLGNIYINFCGDILGFGILGGLDTMGANSYGSEKFKMLGIFTIRTRIMLMSFLALITLPLCIYSESIFLSIGLEQELAEYSSKYIIAMFPTLFIDLNFNVNIKYLQVMQIYFFPSLLIGSGLIIHVCLCFIFICIYDYDIYGLALSSFLTMSFNFLASVVYIVVKNPCPESLMIFHKDVFRMKEFIPYLSLSLYSALQHYGDSIGYEIVTFMSSYLGAINMSANIIVLNFVSLISYIYMGMSIPLTHFVGYFLGKRDFEMYNYTIKFFTCLNLLVGLFEVMLTYFLSYQISGMYSNSVETIEIASNLLKFYSIFLLVDTLNIMFQGILSGAAKQSITSIWNIGMTVGWMLPGSYFICFYFGLGLIGLWISIAIFVSCLFMVNLYYYLTLDYVLAADEVIKQLDEDNEDNINDLYYQLSDI